jgi:hypothetical protein
MNKIKAMKYGFIEPDDFTRNLKFPLPVKAKVLLPNADDIKEGLDKGEDPVILSINKWENIFRAYEIISSFPSPYKYYHELFYGIGYETCALCLNSIEKYKNQFGVVKYKSDKCKVCALAKVDPCPAPQSSYKIIENILGEDPIEMSILSRDKINSLHKLLGDKINKMVENLKFLGSKPESDAP